MLQLASNMLGWVPALPTNGIALPLLLYISVIGSILIYNVWLRHAETLHISSSENLTSISRKMTELALPPWYTRYMYACFRGIFETGRIYAGKLQGRKGTFLRYFDSCFIAWWYTGVRNVSYCLAWKRVLRTPFFTPSGIQHTLSHRKWCCAIIYTWVVHSRNIAKYAILQDSNPGCVV